MKAVRVTKPNAEHPGAAAQVEHVTVPEPCEGEVLVQLRLRPVDPADVFTLMGVYPGAPPPDKGPFTPGLDGMGKVSKLGSGATKFKEGQCVAIAGLLLEEGNGSWAEYAGEQCAAHAHRPAAIWISTPFAAYMHGAKSAATQVHCNCRA